MSDKIGIARVEFSDGPSGNGTKVYLSNGELLNGVLSVSQSAGIDEIQTITVTVHRMNPGPVLG